MSKKIGKKFFKQGNFDGGSKNKGYVEQSSQNRNNAERKYVSNRGPQCHECDGFGHIKSECANVYKYKRISKKAFQARHNNDDVTDNECDGEPNVEHTAHVAITNGECITKIGTTEDPFELEDITEEEESNLYRHTIISAKM